MSILIVRVETESGSIYQLETQVEQNITHVQRIRGHGAVRFWEERTRVVRHSPIVVGQPMTITAMDCGEPRITQSTRVANVEVTLER